ncbi:MAG: hypothetical protein V3V09_08685 [Arenicellales bacterium]
MKNDQHSAEDAPKGTFALMVLLAILMAAGWIYMYFFRFLPHGPVN